MNFYTFRHAKKLSLPAPANSVIFVYMPWCGPSQMAAPLFDEAAKEASVHFFYHDNTDNQLPVRMFPTYIGYNSKKKAKATWGHNELVEAVEYAKT